MKQIAIVVIVLFVAYLLFGGRSGFESPTIKVCCQAMTAECQSCKQNTTIAGYCLQNPSTRGCSPSIQKQVSYLKNPMDDDKRGVRNIVKRLTDVIKKR